LAQAIEFYQQAVALDPVNALARSLLAYNLAMAGRHTEAQAEYPRVIELNPHAPWAYAGLGMSYLLEGKFDLAVTTAQKDQADYARLLVTALARFSQKQLPEADAALGQLTAKYSDTAAYQIAEAYAYRGDLDRAFEWLDRARLQRDPGIVGLQCDRLLGNLIADPRWKSLIRTLGLAPDQLK
jgi:tetratricopeptide (TPR) repeat protein